MGFVAVATSSLLFFVASERRDPLEFSCCRSKFCFFHLIVGSCGQAELFFLLFVLATFQTCSARSAVSKAQSVSTLLSLKVLQSYAPRCHFCL